MNPNTQPTQNSGTGAAGNRPPARRDGGRRVGRPPVSGRGLSLRLRQGELRRPVEERRLAGAGVGDIGVDSARQQRRESVDEEREVVVRRRQGEARRDG